METGAQDPPVPRRRFGLRVLKAGLILLGLGVAAVGLAVGWLVSPWGRGFIAGKISQRCGLEARLDGLGWSPGGGVELRGLRLLQPEHLREQLPDPLLEIASVRFSPEWRMLLKKRLVAREVHLERPKLTLSVEMLSHLAQRAAKPEMGPLAQQPQGQTGQTSPPGPAGQTGPAGPAGPTAQNPATPPQQGPPPVRQETTIPTSWFKIQHGGFKVVSAASGRVFAEVSELSCEVPCAGRRAAGKLRMDHCELLGERMLPGFTARLEWDEPALALVPDPAELEVRGVKFRLAARLGLVPGVPMEARIEVPAQPLAVANLAGLDCAAKDFRGNAYFMGLLVAPGTWQGELLAGSGTVTVRHPEKSWVFDEAKGAVVCRSGVISCVDARLLSEPLSFLGNGTVVADGRVAAVLRVVGTPELPTAVARRLLRDPDLSPTALSLAPANREALDLKLSGTFAEPLLQVGEGAAPKPLRPPNPPPP